MADTHSHDTAPTPNTANSANTPRFLTLASGERFACRLLSLRIYPMPDGSHCHQAQIMFQTEPYGFEWFGPRVSADGLINQLVMFEVVTGSDGTDIVVRIIAAADPTQGTNLFDNVPPSWQKDRKLLGRAAALWKRLPPALAQLVNAVLWDKDRLYRFVTGPSSVAHHHAEQGGNLRHSVEVAETALDIAAAQPNVNRDLLIAAGLLHDAGKIAEYVWDDISLDWRLSPRGELVGHRDTLIEWLGDARRHAQDLPEAQFIALLHIVNARSGAPEYLGLREPRCLEADLLSLADRWSVQRDVNAKALRHPNADGFGRPRAQRRGRAYQTPKPYGQHPAPAAP